MGSYHTYDSFFEEDLSDYDTIFLTTGDRETAPLFDSNIIHLYPHLRVVAIAHGVRRYVAAEMPLSTDKRTTAAPLATPDLTKIKVMMREDRWSFLCLSRKPFRAFSQSMGLGTGTIHLFHPSKLSFP
jgi:hypothetical protein